MGAWVILDAASGRGMDDETEGLDSSRKSLECKSLYLSLISWYSVCISRSIWSGCEYVDFHSSLM